MIEPTGYTALDLVGYTDKGTYAANVNYVKNDLVHYGGNIWRVLIDDTIGIMPAEGTNYTLFIGEPTNLVERIIAPLEDNPATVAYTTGRQIIYNDYLYEVIQNIAVGDILIAYEDDPTNANIKLASPVETQVLALKADKVNKSDIANNVTTTTAGKVLDARQGKALQDGKADNSVIAPVESGTTASRAYAAGAHFIRDSAFCTAKTAIAQGETFTLNTNYTAGDVGVRVAAIENEIIKEDDLSTYSRIKATTSRVWYSLINVHFTKGQMVCLTGKVNFPPSTGICGIQFYTTSNSLFNGCLNQTYVAAAGDQINLFLSAPQYICKADFTVTVKVLPPAANVEIKSVIVTTNGTVTYPT